MLIGLHQVAHKATAIYVSPVFWSAFLGRLHDLAHAFQPPADLAMVATAAVLLTLTSPRNVHLSDRSRANLSEALYQLTTSSLPTEAKLARLRSLTAQNEQFDARYARMSRTFLLLIFSMTGFLLAAAYSYTGDSRIPLKGADYLKMEINGGVVLISVLLFLAVLFFLGVEFSVGSRTLRRNSADFGIVTDSLKLRVPYDGMKVFALNWLIQQVSKLLRERR